MVLYVAILQFYLLYKTRNICIYRIIMILYGCNFCNLLD